MYHKQPSTIKVTIIQLSKTIKKH
uniref:Uncharacterized protein n=1 Tax=Arundo donax TaxID=35708 RepID=A0A0A9EYA5_ARUDO